MLTNFADTLSNDLDDLMYTESELATKHTHLLDEINKFKTEGRQVVKKTAKLRKIEEVLWRCLLLKRGTL